MKQVDEAYDVFASIGSMTSEQIQVIAEHLVRYRPDVAEKVQSSIGVEFREIAIERMEI